MATCFCQYCAMCERMISNPDSSILYCSQRCRNQDSIKPLATPSRPIFFSRATSSFSSFFSPVPIPRSYPYRQSARAGSFSDPGLLYSLPNTTISLSTSLPQLSILHQEPEIMSSTRQPRSKPVQFTAAYQYLAQFLQAGQTPTTSQQPGRGYKNGVCLTGRKEAGDMPLLTHSPATTVDDSPITPSERGPDEKFTLLQNDMIESKSTDLAPVMVHGDGAFLEKVQ
ncbi:hypothetical protein GTR04_6081 [Trichophyton interdigitale]|uniref:Uncharacterized protein n=2 Tax=Trichophyton TaxID=5550 RepID=F2PJZ8_TRIEC|nr:hypothetical protein TESG_05410 [Trichophyton tonsurans CBS 112818]EGE02216.1 hypothetical protein TEQG_01257 [Trichophyton equinum CBS 127.97]KAG5204553.1 hypothetical protein GY631_7093 [Trichophyton interdigitale]KAG5218101.1 hypothetical protein GY632_5891 [Trichophyton interdigitale]KAG8206533.1 hypothetical protein GTR04_6081 [Trichophyton interdigitale]